TFFNRERLLAPPDLAQLAVVKYPYDIEYVGNGEILTVEAMPEDGRRRMEVDRATGFVLDEAYERLPTTFVIRRGELRPKQVALTFDDGPSEPFTGLILDALRDLRVPGTFFVIGENAERHPDLVERIWREGHELGNHSYTHPDIAAVSERRARLELTATQRALQSILGRSTIMFRPPYNADAEPSRADEVRPILLAARLGYLTVGEFIDPRDWELERYLPDGTRRRRTAEEIAGLIEGQVRKERGNTVLLHDGGGDRSRTAAALRLVVPRLQAEGYRFVSVSGLVGASRDQVMPPANQGDAALIGVDRAVFEAFYWAGWLLRLAFLSAIALAVLRIALVSVLAAAARRRERRRTFDPSYRPSVSVLIAAFNEAGVIEGTIRAALAGGDAAQVVVVDDGSRDATAEVVRRAFAADPRVRLLRQENRGKAAALNLAVAASTGEILVCLDADTRLAPGAVAKLARPFADPAVGAVAGNVKVGNLVNLLTRLQSIEYVTSQNLDRRAYARLNAVTVVPGAAGAWRRSAVAAAGGFLADTLAEDMDLTWRIRRAGARVEVEPQALGFTEAPHTIRTLFRQRFRWVFGTLQCLWKHRDALGRYGWFGTLMMPSMWLFQIFYQALSPLIDLQVAWVLGCLLESLLFRGVLGADWQPLPVLAATLYHVGFLYLFFFLIELAGSALAFWMDREDYRRLWWLFTQRFLYRQIMYMVVLKSIQAALVGRRAHWGKIERQGTVAAPD
ncbi:MAG: glycosyltransferase, partial [Elusimicrobia bacterium]|nr:glycosyltransferase [Elusimicrobiota bacterium]